MNTVAALILFFEKPNQTIECLKSLAPYDMDVYLLNNASSVEARRVVGDFAASCPRIHIIDSDTNLGVAGGRNKLIQETTHEWLLFLDNDITALTPSMLVNFYRHITENPDANAIAGQLYNVHYQSWQNLAATPETVDGRTRNRLEKFPGGAAFVNRRMFDAVGLYNDEIFIGLEDFEFAYRAQQKNYEIVAIQVDDIAFMHDHRQVTREEDRKATELRYNAEVIGNSARIAKQIKQSAADGWEDWIEVQKKFMLEPPTLECRACPALCTLYMTSLCNFQCAWCMRNTVGVASAPHLTEATVQALLQKYPHLQYFCIAGQGEPTMTPEFREIVTCLNSHGKHANLITNGTNSGAILDVQGCLSSINISLYGASEQHYVEYCNVPLFSSVVASYEKLRGKFPQVGFSYILDKNNLGRLEEILTLCDRLTPSFIYLINALWYDVRDMYGRQRIIEHREAGLQQEIRDLAANRGYPVHVPLFPDFSQPANLCRSYSNVLNVDGYGNIGGCRRQITPSAEFGNLFSNPDCLNSPEMMRLRHNQKAGFPAHPECTYCFGNWIAEETADA
jgi:GT2 family glycosyltransferase/MoaA/NifB/PqqE/SkfB family radical SAM enzyme